MNQHKFAFSFAWIAALLVATPAVGQLHNFPVYSLGQGPAAGATFVAATFARGLNANSTEQSSFAAAVLRGMEKVSVAGTAGYTASATDELSLAASVAVHLLSDDSTPVQLSLQGGVGWISPAATLLSFPIGIAISGRPSDSGTSVRPWVMPRLDIQRFSEFTAVTAVGPITFPSSTRTDIGTSAGVTITGESGIGAHLAVDWVNRAGGSPFGFSLGGHYMVGN